MNKTNSKKIMMRLKLTQRMFFLTQFLAFGVVAVAFGIVLIRSSEDIHMAHISESIVSIGLPSATGREMGLSKRTVPREIFVELDPQEILIDIIVFITSGFGELEVSNRIDANGVRNSPRFLS